MQQKKKSRKLSRVYYYIVCKFFLKYDHANSTKKCKKPQQYFLYSSSACIETKQNKAKIFRLHCCTFCWENRCSVAFWMAWSFVLSHEELHWGNALISLVHSYMSKISSYSPIASRGSTHHVCNTSNLIGPNFL